MKETERIAGGLQQLNRCAVQAAGSGDYAGALVLFQQALAFEEQLGFEGHVAESLMNIATTYLLLGDHPAALEAVERARELFGAQRRTADLRSAALLRGTILLRSGQYADAARELEACLRQSPPEERAAIYAQAAAALAKLDQQYRAQEYLGRALADYERMGDRVAATACLRQRAALFKAAGRKDLAVRDLQRCATLAGQRGDALADYERLES